MKVDKKTFSGQVSSDDTPALVPEIALHHGQALWLLSELGFRGDAAQSTFYEYLKSLRKLGIPFGAGKIGMARRGLTSIGNIRGPIQNGAPVRERRWSSRQRGFRRFRCAAFSWIFNSTSPAGGLFGSALLGCFHHLKRFLPSFNAT